MSDKRGQGTKVNNDVWKNVFLKANRKQFEVVARPRSSVQAGQNPNNQGININKDCGFEVCYTGKGHPQEGHCGPALN